MAEVSFTFNYGRTYSVVEDSTLIHAVKVVCQRIQFREKKYKLCPDDTAGVLPMTFLAHTIIFVVRI